MRPLLALALLSLALAGCTAGDQSGPPSADPNGSESQPPVAQGTMTTGPPTGTSSPSATDTTTPASSSSSTSTTYAPSFARHDQEDSASDPDFSGIAVNGHLTGSGAQLQIEATANKFSPAQYRVPTGSCSKPWTESMTGPSGPVQPHAPTAACTGFALRDMADNEAISNRVTWDGQLWDSSGHAAPAPSGTYTWARSFHVYQGGTGAQYNDSATMPLTFQVHVQ
jgi:hypothetical protein